LVELVEEKINTIKPLEKLLGCNDFLHTKFNFYIFYYTIIEIYRTDNWWY